MNLAGAVGLVRKLSTAQPPPESSPIVCDVGALVHPDLGAVDALARLQLIVRRAGRRIELRGACARLWDLIDLVGLADELPLCVEPGRPTEEREQPA